MSRIVCFFLGLIFLAVWTKPRYDELPAQRVKEYASQLSGHAVGGVPIIIFSSDTCPYCRQLEKEMKSRKLSYIQAEISTNALANHIHAEIGENVFGQVCTRAVPTVLVGTKIFRGANADIVIRELVGQKLSGQF